jgi:glycerophosphoryl diester phosphodiesterase
VLEVDAKLTQDRVPVAIHDATLDRTTNCSSEVRTFTVAELESANEGQAKSGEHGGERSPPNLKGQSL